MFGFSTSIVQSQVVLPLSQLPGLRVKPKSTLLKRVAYDNQETFYHFTGPRSYKNESKISEIKELLGLDEKTVDLFKSKLEYLAIYPCSRSLSSLSRKNNLLIFERTSPWSQSYSSFHTFTENKNGYPSNFQQFLLNKILNDRSLTHTLLLGDIRTFKTRKSFKKEATDKISVTDTADKISVTDKFLLGKKYTEKILQLEKNSKTELNRILSEEESEQSHKNIKLAFVEGYMAADTRKAQSSSIYSKIADILLRYVLFVVVIIGLAYIFLGGIPFLKTLNEVETNPEDVAVSFDDVQGLLEAKEELQEIVEFLKNPDKFTALGAELPKGVLLVGPPGTGKTLLARAVAGEASVPFYHTSGSQFDEILVGQGAKRVRNLFNSAKARAPCVVFIDEIDSVGAKRAGNTHHPYANQTINQLLSEMDGFIKNEGVIILGATNRKGDLDEALLRPGRFDVEVQVSIPDLADRKRILDYYLKKIKVDPDVDANLLARNTTGFTGADLKNVVNQAALKAASDQLELVTLSHLQEARDKVLMGPEKKNRIPDEETNKITAYHEGGHALVSFYTKYADPLHKVTIIPRGLALGMTASIPNKEQYHVTKSKMFAFMDTLMGGRAAEELIFGADFITAGAASDLQKATAIATNMVKKWGMSDKVGMRTFEGYSEPIGQLTNEAIDAEIKRLLSESYERAKNILKAHSYEHKTLADALLKYETLDADDIKAIANGKKIQKN